MIIDCDGCAVRGVACGDCVIGVLLDAPGPAPAVDPGCILSADVAPGAPSGAPIVQFDAPERRALAVLADQGLIPKLRLVATERRRTSREGGDEGTVRDAV